MMQRRLLVGGMVVAPGQVSQEQIEIVDDKIASVQRSAINFAAEEIIDEEIIDEEIIDVHGKLIVPGFVDLHVHGGQGTDFMDGTVEAVVQAARAHLRSGTTTIFPTTATGSPEQIEAMLVACQHVASSKDWGPLPTIPGIHLYGPFFAADKVGCHSVAGRRSPTPEEYGRYFNSDFVSIATCAAELEGAEQFYRAAARASCLLTCGHSNANWEEMSRAFDCGVRHVDHFWCAMSSVQSLKARFGTPMQASMTEFVLMNREMSTEVIADGYHLSPELLEFAYKMIGPDRLCLVTDCNRALGMPPGRYRFGNHEDGSWFLSNGSVGLAEDGQSLASSIVGMDHMVRQMSRSTSASLPEVIRMATLTPAKRAGVDHLVGSIEVGKRADLLVLSQDLLVERIFLGGKEVLFG